MPKPAIFIGSSAERLDLAHALQEGLEHKTEPTVWTQGVFAPSRTTMESLLVDVLESTDFGAFVFAPDDVVLIRDQAKSAVRDNVIFEIGLFMGRLGRERTFIVMPRGVPDLRLPTDLLGITAAEYDSDRQDGNMVAALGPACSRILRAIEKQGPIDRTVATQEPDVAVVTLQEGDVRAILTSWMGSRTSSDNAKVIRFRETDTELNLPPGSGRAARKVIHSPLGK